jgi:hypothetical protein
MYIKITKTDCEKIANFAGSYATELQRRLFNGN